MLREFLLTLIVCVDTYFVAVNYGTRRIKIPLMSAVTISFIGAGMLGLSLTFSGLLTCFIPTRICELIGFFALSAIGMAAVLKSVMRRVVRRMTASGDVCIKMSGIGLGIRLYLDDTSADTDESKELSVKESAALAVTLSLDSAATGINSGFLQISTIRVSVMVFAAGIIAVGLGFFTGKRASEAKYDFSWLSGIMLIILAVIGIV